MKSVLTEMQDLKSEYGAESEEEASDEYQFSDLREGVMGLPFITGDPFDGEELDLFNDRIAPPVTFAPDEIGAVVNRRSPRDDPQDLQSAISDCDLAGELHLQGATQFHARSR